MTTKTRQIQLASRPQGWPTHDDFDLVSVELPDPGPGEVLVRNTVMSVDPYMRGRMNDVKSYVPPFQIGEPLDGGAVGEVVASGDDTVRVGDTVMHGLGWREHALLPAAQVRKVDASAVPASAYLGVLGMPGLTAYTGLTRIAGLKKGDSVFVSGAAGAVGSVVGQLARNLGASRVVGSAGSPEKVAYLTEELGFDSAFDYHDGPVVKQLAEHAPDGVDVYFDNVGGEHLEGAVAHMNDFGRIAMCGAISQYNADTAAPGPRNIWLAVTRRLTLRGFIVTDHNDLAREYLPRAAGWVADGSLKFRETYVEGLDRAVDAFLGLHKGENIGKMLVRLDRG
ncbi:NADP-dependent oxidoreductase [Nocardioides sp. WL0053]|uniref:NADP-dependent oxidoreductase n=1 Tax=Nocardioides jiangsuensis TaxID=2866161 RepID=A0ABS7RE53_9ACTN|nr:NADP-dependent oxidoreductase [Nocardioides jiangsuensis]MBY9073289.1 NADP-dependent oxidoreductase [Nocardioides jiangsuensis]